MASIVAGSQRAVGSSNTSGFTIPFFNVADVPDRALLTFVNYNNSALTTIDSLSFSLDASPDEEIFIKIGETVNTGPGSVAAFILINPSAGRGTITVNMTTTDPSEDASATNMVLEGVNQIAPYSDVQMVSGVGTTSNFNIQNVGANDLAIADVSIDSPATTATITAGTLIISGRQATRTEFISGYSQDGVISFAHSDNSRGGIGFRISDSSTGQTVLLPRAILSPIFIRPGSATQNRAVLPRAILGSIFIRPGSARQLNIFPPRETLQRLLVQYLELDDSRVVFYGQEFDQPTDFGIFVIIGNTRPQIVGVKNEFNPAENEEIITMTTHELHTIDIASKGELAFLRKEEIVMALSSQLARNLEEENNIRFFRPSEIQDLTAVEGPGGLHRYRINVIIASVKRKVTPVSVYDQFIFPEVTKDV